MEISQQYNAVPVKDNCALFALTPYYWARPIRRCHLNFFPADPCCHGNKFWIKIDYNSGPVKNNCARFAPTPLFSGPGYPIMSFKFLPCRPVAMAMNFGTKLTTTRPPWKTIVPCLHLPLLYAAARLHSVGMGQIPRSTEHISSCWCVPTLLIMQTGLHVCQCAKWPVVAWWNPI